MFSIVFRTCVSTAPELLYPLGTANPCPLDAKQEAEDEEIVDDTSTPYCEAARAVSVEFTKFIFLPLLMSPPPSASLQSVQCCALCCAVVCCGVQSAVCAVCGAVYTRARFFVGQDANLGH